MKATELMVGDLVCLKDDTKYELPLKVDGIIEDDISLEGDGFLGGIDGLIRPIPFTPEILEKNGWIQCKYETCKSLYEYKGLHLRHTMIKRSNGRWVANVDGIVEKFPDEYTHSYLRINVFYVHELQHALRLCGLNEIADNFKV